NVKFPEEYHSEELKGKDAVFHVKLNAITCEELPELDDDFAAEVSDFDTFAQYRADIQSKLEQAAQMQATDAAKQSMVDLAVSNATVEVPDPLVEDKLDEMLEQMGWRMQQQGFSLEQYCKITGQTEEQMREMYRAEALASVKSELVIDEIVKAENVQADDADVDKLLSEYASSMNQTLDQMKANFNDGQMEYFKHRASISKLFDQLWACAKVNDEEAAEATAEAQA
ncbi:MAG: trigger factor, partial [Clostridia bacterium]